RKRQTEAGMANAVPYKPVPPHALYLDPDEVDGFLASRSAVRFTPFETPEGERQRTYHAGARAGRSFAEERADPNANVFDHVVRHIGTLRGEGRRVLLAAWSEGSLDRLLQILEEHGLGNTRRVKSLAELQDMPDGQAGLAVLPLEAGFERPDLAVIAEQDILGDRLVRRSRRRKRAADFIADIGTLAAGDIIVHADHGIGRFVGLRTIEAAGAPHECLELRYAGDDRLFLPVENIELLS